MSFCLSVFLSFCLFVFLSFCLFVSPQSNLLPPPSSLPPSLSSPCPGMCQRQKQADKGTAENAFFLKTFFLVWRSYWEGTKTHGWWVTGCKQGWFGHFIQMLTFGRGGGPRYAYSSERFTSYRWSCNYTAWHLPGQSVRLLFRSHICHFYTVSNFIISDIGLLLETYFYMHNLTL